MTIVYAIIILLLLIFVHETGHLIAAKITGIQVNEFALGMGPKLIGFKRGETLYSFRAIPFGGFCSLEGDGEDSENPRAFNNKPARSRAFVLFAGSGMNIVLAIVALSMIFYAYGFPTLVLSDVEDKTPAYANGLRAGDQITAINDIELESWSEVRPILAELAKREEQPRDLVVNLSVLRDGTELSITTGLAEDENGDLRLGVSPKFNRSPASFFKSFYHGTKETGNMGKMMVEVLGGLVTGKVGLDQLTGPIGIVVAVGETAEHGFIYIVQLTALISLNLAIVNLLPFPALDGGRLLFLLIRKITGKAISEVVEGRIHFIGIIILFAFMALITLQDIDRFIIK